MSKVDQIRALRERAYEARLSSPAYDRRSEKIKPEAHVINVINTGAQRQAKWRKANAELNRFRAREGMRKIRAQPEDKSVGDNDLKKNQSISDGARR